MKHLVAGVVVLPADILQQLLKLPHCQYRLVQQLEQTDAPLGGIFSQALFVTGEDYTGFGGSWCRTAACRYG